MARLMIEEYRKTQAMVEHDQQLKRHVKILTLSFVIIIVLFISCCLIDILSGDMTKNIDEN
jgi:hypothetical protein